MTQVAATGGSPESQVVQEVVSDIVTKSEEPQDSAAAKSNEEDFDDDDVDVHIDSIANHVPTSPQSSYSLSHHAAPPHLQQSIPSLQRPAGVDVDRPGVISGVSTLDYDLNQLRDEDKPWRKPGADITDYFNYGFNEETWMLYCIKQRRLRAENQQINAVVQKTAALNASGLMAQVFRGGKPNPLIGRRQGPTSIDVIGATDETSRRQAAAAAVLAAAAQRASVPDMSTPPPGYAAGNAILGQLQRAPMAGSQAGNAGNFLQPSTAALQLQQQFAAALAAVRFPARPVGPPFMPPGCRVPGPPRNSAPQMWENPNAPRDEKERSSSVDRRAEWQSDRPDGPYGFRHPDDRRFESPRRYYEHKHYRRRGKSSPDRRYDSPPRHRHRYDSRHRSRSPGPPGSSARRRDSSNDSDGQRRKSRRRYQESRSPSGYHSSSRHKRKSRSGSRKSGSHRRASSRRQESRSRSRSKRKEETSEPSKE